MACIGERTGADSVLVAKPEEKSSLERPGRRRKDIGMDQVV